MGLVDGLSPSHRLRPQLQGRLVKILFPIMIFVLASCLA